MKVITLIASLLCMIISLTAIPQTKTESLRLIRIKTPNPTALWDELELAQYDVIGSQSPGSLDVVVSIMELEKLQKLGLSITEIRRGRPLRDVKRNESKLLDSLTGYPDLSDIIDQMNATAAAYPAIAKVYDLTALYNVPPTFEGRHMYAIKISDNVASEEDEPDVMIVSNHHGREVVTPVIALYAMEQFTSNYGIDVKITAAVDNNEIWIAPTWNPDGLNYVFTVDDMWRKNRRVFSNGIGVEQNRNYPHLWNNPCSGSTNVNSNGYKGPSPSSESETKTMIAWGLDQRFAKMMDYHSPGRQVLWAYRCDPPHPFDNWLHEEARELASNSGYTGYANTRRSSGDGENYQWHLAKTGTYSFLIETSTEFAPAYASALTEAERVWPGILWNIELAIPLSGHVTDAVTGIPVEANLEFIGWRELSNRRDLFQQWSLWSHHAFLPAGQYDVRFSASGYTSVTKSVNITSGSQAILEVQLSPCGLTDINNNMPLKDASASKPAKFVLHNVYPNPFNPQTTIKFELPKDETVQLSIYNSGGQLVRTFVANEVHAAGTHQYHWDSRNQVGNYISGGIYFILCRAGRFQAIQKVMLIK